MAVCTGACIFGKCPNSVCVRYEQKRSRSGKLNIQSRILDSISEGSLIKGDREGYGVAVDIGTTTVVLYLFDIGKTLCMAVKSALNNQITLGVDVISRINYAAEAEGLAALHDSVVSQINSLAGDACHEAGISTDDISRAVITGNTTMLHLLEGLSPVSMGVLPFIPESKFGYCIKAEKAGLAFVNAEVYLTPCMSAFVGGDITSSVLASGMCESNDISLLMDLGTNGELVLGNRNKIYTTSTAAGPAFEGSEIEKGMAGVIGAVNTVYPFQGEVRYDVIGDVEPAGICGSGILDMTALFVRLGCIEETGYIADEGKYIVGNEDGNVIFLAENVYLTQKDIRQIQTAKAAVAGGVRTLAYDSGIDMSDIQHVYIAGGFGNFMQQSSASDIGLLAPEFSDRIKCIGNGAGTGAIMAMLNKSFVAEGEKVAALSEHVELGGNPYFMNQYVECMMF